MAREVTVEQIKELRAETGMGLHECKRFLYRERMLDLVSEFRMDGDRDKLCEVLEWILRGDHR